MCSELYEGPGKKIGFQYKEYKPTEEYILSIDFIMDPALTLSKFKKSIPQILKNCKIEENWWRVNKFNKEGDIEIPGNEQGDVYTLAVAFTAYNKWESDSASNEILFSLMDFFGEKIYFDPNHVHLGGTDLPDTDDEEEESPQPSGFKQPTKPKFVTKRISKT
jgi:hypothetical protein